MTDNSMVPYGAKSNTVHVDFGGVPHEFHEIASVCAASEVVIGGKLVIGIEDARTLHAGLGIGKDYSTWMRRRISKYGFARGIDYEVFTQTGENPLGGRPENVYRITLDMAKELAMVENNDRGRLIRRYYIWLEQQSHSGMDFEAAPPALTSSREVKQVFADYHGIARMIGFDKNQAALAANNATVKICGVNPLEQIGATHLLAPQQEAHLTATQIAEQLGLRSAQAANKKMDDLGYQLRELHSDAGWKPTPKGERFAVWLDTGKRHSGGSPVRQLRWSAGIVAAIRAEMGE